MDQQKREILMDFITSMLAMPEAIAALTTRLDSLEQKLSEVETGVDYDKLADVIDYSSIADEIDYNELSREISLDDLADKFEVSVTRSRY